MQHPRQSSTFGFCRPKKWPTPTKPKELDFKPTHLWNKNGKP